MKSSKVVALDSPLRVSVIESFGDFVAGQDVVVDRVMVPKGFIGVQGENKFFPFSNADEVSRRGLAEIIIRFRKELRSN